MATVRGNQRWALAAGDLVYSMWVLPLLCMDFRPSMSEIVSCSDASLHGAGVVFSCKLTSVGRAGLSRELRTVADVCDRYWGGGEESFVGIGSCCWSASLLRLRPRAYVAIKICNIKVSVR